VTGRRAALPAEGYQPPARLLLDGGRCVARFTTEDGRRSKDYDFGRLPVPRPLQIAFAEAFCQRTGPAGTCKSLGAVGGCYDQLRTFAVHLSEQAEVPASPAEVTAGHLEGYAGRHRQLRGLAQRLGMLKRTLRSVTGWNDEFAAALRGPGGLCRDRSPKVHSYSEQEFRRIVDAARADARRIATRVRTHRQLLERSRASQLGNDTDPLLEELLGILDHIERSGDVPRRDYGDSGRFFAKQSLARHGRVPELIGKVYLTWADAAPFVVLLVALTGQNGGTIAEAPAAHHRPDALAGGTRTAIVELVKPRRGRRSHMPVALAELPDWLTADEDSSQQVSARDELHTPLGVYLLLRELTEPARQLVGTDRLLVGWHRQGWHIGRGNGPNTLGNAVNSWGRRAAIMTDSVSEDAPAPLTVALARLRLTAAEHRQQAVAHTDQVLANEYLGRNRGNITAYQQLVGRVLDEQVTRAKASALMPMLNEADLAEAREHPEAVADRLGLNPTTLKRVLTGELDTVMAACVDHHGGPHAPPGQPCRASFMRCLDCPCARAAPQHLPVQVLVLDALTARRGDLPPLEWAHRFALPHAQLTDLLDRHPLAAVQAARAAATDADRRLVERFLNRELDHR
jgi:hypothetical protein